MSSQLLNKFKLTSGPARLWLSPRRKRFWGVVILLLYTVTGFWVAPWVAKRQLLDYLNTQMPLQAELGELAINPFALSVTARQFKATDNDGNLLAAFDRLYVNLQLSSVFHRALTFGDIVLERPAGEVVRYRNGEINYQRLLAGDSKSEEPEEERPIFPLIIQNLAVTDGLVTYIDHTAKSRFELAVRPINLHVRNLSTRHEDDGVVSLKAKSERGTELSWQGSIAFSPFQSKGLLHASGSYFPVAYQYFKDKYKARVTDGSMTLDVDYDLSLPPEGLTVRIRQMDVQVKDLQVEDGEGQPVLVLPRLAIDRFALSWPEKMASIESISLDQGALYLSRLPDNSLNLLALFSDNISPGESQPGVTPEVSRTATYQEQPTSGAPSSGSGTSGVQASEVQDASQSPLADWQLSIEQVALTGQALHFTDRSLQTSAEFTLQDFNASLTGLTNQPEQKFPLAMTGVFASGGSVGFEGELKVLPEASVSGVVQLNNLALQVFNPYLQEYASASLQDGLLSTQFQVTTGGASTFTGDGNLAIDNLSILESLDKTPLVGWQKFGVDNFDFNLGDNGLKLGQVDLVAPYVRFQIDRENRSNFQKLIKPASEESASIQEPAMVETTPTEAGQSTPLSLAIWKVRLDKGSADFADFSLPIPFETRIADITGEVATVDTGSRKPTDIDISGQVAAYGQARLQGSLLAADPLGDTDMALQFRNVELPDMSPYSVKFAGRKIKEGKMDLDLNYKLDKGKLQGENNILIRSFSLGEQVDYPDAMDLPLDLAVALLRGPDGNIDVDLPVSGDVNDPKFSLGSVIGKALVNLVVKAAAAPFRLLGALIGVDAEALDNIRFEPGSAELSPPEKEKLAQLAEGLAQRPQLKLIVAPAVAPEVDGLAIKTRQVEQLIDESVQQNLKEGASLEKRQKVERAVTEALFRETFPDQSLDPIEDAHRTPGPESGQGFDTTAYLADLTGRIISATSIGPDGLKTLVDERGAAILNELTVGLGLPEQRVVVKARENSGKVNTKGWVETRLDLKPISTQ